MTEADAHEVDVGNPLDWDAQPGGQTWQKGRRQEEVLLALVRDVFVGEHGVDGVDVLRRPHDRSDPNRERGAGGRLVVMLHPAGESAVLDLCRRVGVKMEAAPDVEVALLGHQLVDGDVEGVVRIREASGDHQRTIDRAKQVGVGHADRVEASIELTAGIRRQEEVGRSEVGDDLRKINDALFQGGQGERAGRRASGHRGG